MNKGLLIELIDPVITSASAASTTVPQTLPYIPGAMLLGVAAARGYGSGIARDDAFDLFHSGAVRFDDGLPLGAADQVGLPNPISIHYTKGEDSLVSKNWVDLSVDEREPGLEQLRGESIAAGMTPVPVKTSATLRTAINRKTGRAADAQFFGYQMLDAEQKFLAGIDAQDAASLQKAIDCLLGVGNFSCEVILGRSKSGEFGRVRLTRCDSLILPKSNNAKLGRAYLWCLSDLWAYDDACQPTAAPTGDFFNGGSINWSRSFTRNRQFSPYNAHWKARAPERVLIQRGSVIVLDGSALKPGIHRFGLGQEQGYGRMLVSADPPMKTLEKMTPQVIKLPMDNGQQVEGIGNSVLVDWLTQMSPRSKLNVSADLEVLVKHYETAKNIAGYAVGPGPSQWGSLASLLRKGKATEAFLNAARSNIERHQWKAIYGTREDDNFKSYTQQAIGNKGSDYAALLAKETRKWLEQEGWFDEK